MSEITALGPEQKCARSVIVSNQAHTPAIHTPWLDNYMPQKKILDLAHIDCLKNSIANFYMMIFEFSLEISDAS
jgi:hypothetical protein